jgi:hypothetical protein
MGLDVIVLHLGVYDIPYTQYETPEAKPRKVKPGKLRQARKKRKRKVGRSVSTGDVAVWLENKYHIMEIYYELHEKQLAASFAEGFAQAFETHAMGGPLVDPLAGSLSTLQASFKQFLSMRGMDALGYPGIPTRASLLGVNHRMKQKRGAPRPSFIDTGLYQSSFVAWSDKK